MKEKTSSQIEQLQRALDANIISQETFCTAVAALTEKGCPTEVTALGNGASATGSAGISIGGSNYGELNTGVLIQAGTRPGASREDLRRAYLARVLLQADQLPLFAGDTANSQIHLSSVYTALLTSRGEAEDQSGANLQHRSRPTDEPIRQQSAVDVLNDEGKLVFLGGPGSGKSAFIGFVALSMAGELLGLKPNLSTLTTAIPRGGDDEESPAPQRWDRPALLPVFITLRDLASQLPPSGVPANAETVWDYIVSRLKQGALEAYAPHLEEELHHHGGLVLLDGLDEVPDADNRRTQIKAALQDFVETFSQCRFLVTSRTYAYERQDWKLNGFAEVHLLPFTPKQIDSFVDAWYAHMVQLCRLTSSDADNRARVLKREVRHNERIGELAERPLLLTLIAQLQTEGGGSLPEKPESLYDKSVEMLLDKWERMKIRVRDDGSTVTEPSLAEWLKAGRDQIRRQLNRLAFAAHRDQPQLTGTADIRQQELIEALLQASSRQDVRVLRLEEYLRDRAGILAAHGVGMYQFPHRSFQEYLAACHLTDDDFPDKLAGLACNEPNRWREVVRLAGAKAARGASNSAWDLSEALCPVTDPSTAISTRDAWGALLAGEVLAEYADLGQIAPRNARKWQHIRAWQHEVLRGRLLPAGERALAGRTLAALGDSRTEVTTLDGMRFCLVPAGPFLMGEGGENNNPQPLCHTGLDEPFFIAQYPITVAQWREYLETGGRIVRSEDRPAGRPNEPITRVSWHDAQRLCAHLSERWRRWLPDGWRVTLPSEAEWEKAARGGEHLPTKPVRTELAGLVETLAQAASGNRITNPCPARAYPWGDPFDPDSANTGGGLGGTSAVGSYRHGAGPYGCEEMSGNVWEWTRSLWGTNVSKPQFAYPYDPHDGREDPAAGDEVLRVVRGGSWFGPGSGARCASRGGVRPGSRGGRLGFRVVLRSAPVRSER